MKGFLLGLVVAALGFAGYVWGYPYLKDRMSPAPRKVATVSDAGAQSRPAKERKRRRRGAHLVRSAGPSTGQAPGGAGRAGDRGRAEPPPPLEPEPEPIKLSAADLKVIGQGDDLSRPDVKKFDMSDDRGVHELTQDEIDDRFRARQDDIIACIFRSRPDEETYVPGRVTVKFRIQPAGTVRGVKVEAPSILMKAGLYGCIKGVVGGIRFPPSASSQILTYPFSLS